MVKQLSVATLLLLGPCSGTSSTVGTCLAPAGLSLADRLHAHLSEEEKGGFSGAVQVVRGDSTIFAGEFGRVAADGHPTPFWIASISKAFAATGVMRLVEQGKLSLVAPLSTWFPEAPPAYAGVTVHHLLSHRSGLPVEYAADGVADADVAARAILALSPRGQPGQFFYSNDGYSLLAILVERVSGSSYEDYVRSNIFEPAGMTASGFWGFEPVPTLVAPPVRAPASPAIWADGRGVASYGYRGATGIFSTVDDLTRFARAFRAGKLVSLSAVQTMISSKNPDLGPDAQSYGYGWAIRFRGGVLSEYWHGGNESPLGHNGQLRVSGNDIVVTLSNSGETGDRSWASRIDEGVKACMQ